MVSVIIPTFNEVTAIRDALEHLARARGDFEVIVADGESTDGTAEQVSQKARSFPRPLRLLRVPRPRAVQLNEAAKVARGGVLWFLHADVRMPPDAIETLTREVRADSALGGNFDLVFEGESGWNRFFTWANRARRRFGIYYGDSGIFVRREVFENLGGFKVIPIMEDYEFVRRLERHGKTLLLTPKLLVSDRRWSGRGVLKTLLSWVAVQSFYSLGISAQRLERWYPPVRAGHENSWDNSCAGSTRGRES